MPSTIRKSHLWLQDNYTKWIYRGIDQILGDTHVSKIWQQLHCTCTCSYDIQHLLCIIWLALYCKRARWTESCSVISYPSGQDSSILSCKKVVFFFFHTVCIINPLLTNFWVLYLSFVDQHLGFLFVLYWSTFGKQGWCSVESTCILLMWPGLDSGQVSYVSWGSCWFSPCSKGFFLGSQVFLPPHKTNTLDSNFTRIYDLKTSQC